MKRQSVIFRRANTSFAALAILVGVAAPGIIPALASADVVTSRSIAMSSSVAAASGVSYDLTFTAPTAAGAFVVEFCSNSPLLGADCTAPTDFVATGATTTAGSTTVTTPAANRVKVVKTIGAASTVNVDLNGLTNPTAVGTFYARIATFADSTAADTYATSGGADKGTTLDEGAVALSTTSGLNIDAAVLETMTFCVASADITPDCANAGLNLPSLTLGETSGSVKALTPTALSTGTLYAQLTTNAASGAVVNMKSNLTGCGGLKRGGAAACDIAPSAVAGFVAGEAKFGVKTGTVASATGATNPSGTIVPAGSYNASTYFMNYVDGDATGVTSTYGDPFLNSNSLPVNNKNMPFTFGASITNDTPAGSYSAKLNLIAVGTF